MLLRLRNNHETLLIFLFFLSYILTEALNKSKCAIYENFRFSQNFKGPSLYILFKLLDAVIRNFKEMSIIIKNQSYPPSAITYKLVFFLQKYQNSDKRKTFKLRVYFYR